MSTYERSQKIDPASIEGRLRARLAEQHKSYKTANSYARWWNQYMQYCKAKKIGKETKAEDAVQRFLTSLAMGRGVSANTQNQAFSALCYVYREVLARPLVNVSALRAKRPDAIRDVLDGSELLKLFEHLHGAALLAARMMYASSFRIGEVVAVRIKDISFERRQIVIRRGKGAKDRLVPFPDILHEAVSRQIEVARTIWQRDIDENLNGVSLPDAFGRKSSSAHKQFAWYYLFCSDTYSKHPITGQLLRHHRDADHLGRQIHNAAIAAEIHKRITSHCLRHSFGTHFVENGGSVHVLQKLMGHASIETTEGYLHASKHALTNVVSPLTKLESREPPLESMLANPKPKQEPFTLRVFAG
jgi:integron integrase